MGVSFNVDKALKDSGYNGGFKKSLKKILWKLQTDPNITNFKEAAYLLATAKVESNYSLQRWESDYQCTGPEGQTMYGRSYKELPKNQPCVNALNYYKSTNGKSNYYDKGIDNKGLPYFGRGLIQLTGQHNYQKYGEKIGVDLINNADKALKPNNSYKIASAYLKNRTFKYVNENNLSKARESVKGSSKGWEEVKNTYDNWLKNLEKNKTKSTLLNYAKPILIVSGVAVFGVTGLIIYGIYRKKFK